MVFYGITLPPLTEDIWAPDTGLLNPFYADDVTFDGLARRSGQTMKKIMEWKIYCRYFPEQAKSLFIAEFPAQEEAVR